MKFLLLPIFICTFCTAVSAQPVTVYYDEERSYFNENQPLPVEKQMLFTGNVNPAIEAVDLSFFTPKGRKDRAPLHTASWKKPAYKSKTTFEIPVNYKLRASSEYDVELRFYRLITENERANLKEKLYENMDAYISLAFAESKKKSKHIVDDMNQVVHNGLRYFKNLSSIQFEGFSDLILEKVKLIEQSKQPDVKGSGQSPSGDNTIPSYRESLLKELQTLVYGELEQLLNTSWAVLIDARYIEDYPTEKTLNILAVNGGYGGVIMTGIDSLSFGGSPYIGFSFPLGKKAMSSPFWSNTSVNVGVFINNFKDDSGVELTGPIFKRPYYVGLGYKAFKFIRFNAGATFLEDVDTAGFDFSGLNDRVAVRPFIGISAEINLWMSFAK